MSRHLGRRLEPRDARHTASSLPNSFFLANENLGFQALTPLAFFNYRAVVFFGDAACASRASSTGGFREELNLTVAIVTSRSLLNRTLEHNMTQRRCANSVQQQRFSSLPADGANRVFVILAEYYNRGRSSHQTLTFISQRTQESSSITC